MRISGGLTYGVSLAALVCATAGISHHANAGAFAIREQSAYYQGMSFAGAGTGDTLSSMYWNSAAAAAAPGMNTETHISLILPDSEITADGGAALFVGGPESGDIADPALVPASYANYQLTDRLFLGIAINSGFGLVTKPDNEDWAGSVIAVTSDVFSINVNPTIAYKLTPELTVGVGVQIEYLEVNLRNGSSLPISAALPFGRSSELDDIGIGFTAGASWTPTPGTTIGVGWRSAVDFDLEGDYAAPASPVLPTGAASSELTLPDIVTIGLRQSISENVTLLAGFEWTNWSEVGSIPVNVSTPRGTGTAETLLLDYEDGYFYSLGLEYKYSPATTFRFGVAYEQSPINDETRSVLLPDSDRYWVSVGATHKFSDKISMDFGYTHIFAEDAPICRSSGNAPCAVGRTTVLSGEAESSVDIVSASFKYKWGDAEPALEPLK